MTNKYFHKPTLLREDTHKWKHAVPSDVHPDADGHHGGPQLVHGQPRQQERKQGGRTHHQQGPTHQAQGASLQHDQQEVGP